MRAPFEAWRPTCTRPQGLVSPVRIDPAGVTGPTPGQSRGPRWRRSSHGFYVPSTTRDDLPEQRAVEQAARLPDHGAVTGWAACRLHGAAFFDGLATDGVTRIPVPLAVSPSSALRPDRRITVSRERLALDETVMVGGVRVTRRRHALFDEMRRTGSLRDAVVAMDMMAAAELVSIRQMRAYAATSAVRRCVPLVHRALDRPRGVRRWTLTPPRGWYGSWLETLPLDDRLVLREEMHRAAGEDGVGAG